MMPHQIQQTVTYDEMMLKAGGFGRMQWLTSFVLIFCFLSNGYICYGVEFLEKYPAYLRLDNRGQWVRTTRDEICDHKIPSNLWKIDYSDS